MGVSLKQYDAADLILARHDLVLADIAAAEGCEITVLRPVEPRWSNQRVITHKCLIIRPECVEIGDGMVFEHQFLCLKGWTRRPVQVFRAEAQRIVDLAKLTGEDITQ